MTEREEARKAIRALRQVMVDDIMVASDEEILFRRRHRFAG
jgi:hypothetical protein